MPSPPTIHLTPSSPSPPLPPSRPLPPYITRPPHPSSLLPRPPPLRRPRSNAFSHPPHFHPSQRSTPYGIPSRPIPSSSGPSYSAGGVSRHASASASSSGKALSSRLVDVKGKGKSTAPPLGDEAERGKKGGEHVGVIRGWMGGRRVGGLEGSFLNLSEMSHDPILLEAGIFPPGHPKALSQIGEVFWKIGGMMGGVPITTLSLARNNLKDLRQLSALSSHLKFLTAIDLSGNPDVGAGREGWRDLDFLCGREKGGGALKDLKEIKLDGSTLRENLVKTGEKAYLKEMLIRFPNLELLDGVVIPRIKFDVGVGGGRRQPIPEMQFAAVKSQTWGWPRDVRKGWEDGEGVGSFVLEFLAKFFQLFDTDRRQLLPVYAANATASVNIALGVTPRARLANFHHTLPNQTKLSLTPYLEAPSRNVLRSAYDRKGKSLVVVEENRANLEKWLIETLPGTTHPLNDPGKWVYDSLDMGEVGGVGRVLLTVHGEFSEAPVNGMRSFSRVFLLSIAVPGSPATLAGWNAMILSDQLTVRPFHGSAVFTESLAVAGAKIYEPNPPPSMPGVPAGLPAQAVDGVDVSMLPADILSLPGKVPQQMLIIAQIQQQTNLTTQLAMDLAQLQNYDLKSSMAKYAEVRGSIPADGFRPGGPAA